jgi:aspartate aminotransferase
MRFAERMSRLGTENAFEVFNRAKKLEAQGKQVIHLELGEPDFATPAHVIATAKQALDDGWTHYNPPQGLPQLREAIAEEVASSRGIAVSPEEVVVEPGAKPIIFYTMLALIEPGDEVIYPNPGFPIYESVVNFIGAKPVPLPFSDTKDGFRLDLNRLADLITDRTRMLVLNSPHNPTGSAMPPEDVETIAKLIGNRDIMVLSDEIYHRILYKGVHKSISALPGMRERTIILDGFSKTYAMTGWRLGYGVMPRELALAVTRLGINNHSCTAAFSQVAAVSALRGPQTDADHMVAEFRRRRDFIVAALNRIPGFRCHEPEGAFYVFPNITGTGRSSADLAHFLLEEVGVAGLSGAAFGKYGEGYLRFSYANSIENIGRAMEKIEAAMTAAVHA